MPNKLPLVSLLICSRDRPRLLLDTVESVLKGDEGPAELVIVDQSDTPHPTIPGLQARAVCEISYQWTRSTGLSRARNIGISAAQHPVIAIIDDDMYVAADWFRSLIDALVEAGERAVVTGRVLPASAEAPGGFVPALVTGSDPAVYEGRISIDVLAGGHMAARHEVLEEIGGFDERLGAGSSFPAADDNDLGFRLLEAGYRIVYAPEAVVSHRAWRPSREYLQMRWRYGRGKGGYYTKHLSLHDRHMLERMGKDIARRVIAFPRRIVRERQRASCDVVYVLGILYGSIQWLLTQRKKG